MKHLVIPPPKYAVGTRVRNVHNDDSDFYTIGFRAFSPDHHVWYYEDTEGLFYSYAEKELISEEEENNQRKLTNAVEKD